MLKESMKRQPAFRLDQRILVPRPCRINVEIGRSDIVVAGQDDGDAGGNQASCMRMKSLEPGELIVELWPWLGISIRQIDAADKNAPDRSFNVAALAVGLVARQLGLREYGICSAREDGNAVPSLLAPPDNAIATRAKLGFGERTIRALELLKADNVRLGSREPIQQI
ncbi:hypothetical protein DK26_01515 [Bosea sp. WAO]|nr:hypothetical protein DK26_01515 [Bosea sp. WAO]